MAAWSLKHGFLGHYDQWNEVRLSDAIFTHWVRLFNGRLWYLAVQHVFHHEQERVPSEKTSEQAGTHTTSRNTLQKSDSLIGNIQMQHTLVIYLKI